MRWLGWVCSFQDRFDFAAHFVYVGFKGFSCKDLCGFAQELLKSDLIGSRGQSANQGQPLNATSIQR